MNTPPKKNTHGGYREGSGSKGKYTCDTKKFTLYVPINAEQAIRTFAKKEAKKYLKPKEEK